MFGDDEKKKCDPRVYITPASKTLKDLEVQLVLSFTIGISAFVAFCILRPRWPSLYAARKRRLDPRIGLPALTDSFFGWIPGLYRVTEEQILASAGLDAFVFLTFFKMAIRLFATMAFFAIVVLWPINYRYRNFQSFFNITDPDPDDPQDWHVRYSPVHLPIGQMNMLGDEPSKDRSRERTWLWAYVVFTYFFVFLTLYSINIETFRIIGYRQDYLGSQSTVTDRTFRLTGIPTSFRSEPRIRTLIEKLGIGKVSAVNLCRDWKKLDHLVEERLQILRKLEAAWAKHLGHQRVSTNGYTSSFPNSQSDSSGSDSQGLDGNEDDGENGRLLGGMNGTHLSEGDRPQITVRYGIFGFRSRKVDAIDYYEEKLRRMNERVVEARKEEYAPTDMVLVTMDSVTSCQMVTQARIDPRPGRFLTKAAPAPSDLVWKNTYERRGVRRLKSWAITLFITFLTLVWIFPTAFLASWLSICTLKTYAPSFSHWLEGHSTIHSLFQNGLPTLVVSFLNVAVPYLYDWLSNRQGMISHGDVELSLVSKNFFFTFFNTFFVFAVSRTGFDFWSVLQGFLKDTSQIPAAIAADVDQLSIFYINFIMLQAIGLMPFRILEIGSVFLFPINRFLAKTPRDYAALHKPPTFQYGFYLPTALLVFNLCIIYSVLTRGFVILVFGTVYFSLGYFTYKYMVLYAMDQPQHATGRAWPLICYRIVIGLLVFEVVMVGQIASLAAFVQSVVILPLIPFTIWYSYYYKRRFDGLMKYIALRAIQHNDHGEDEAIVEESDEEDEASPTRSRSRVLLRRGSTLDELKERGQTFVNPSLTVPLEQPWVYKDPPPLLRDDETVDESGRSSRILQPALILPNADSSLGIGDDNVWIDQRRRNSS
ncbi:Calcium permeable stress-gated cation channel 1 [Cladobotryum mycophilum]|uniref:Calcium permeable stress-gated cation channel 1 n=1 Tax=Cladobotryum mycophilum TaxID=491253 RepID=A0ABR0S9Q0_9HYPO